MATTTKKKPATKKPVARRPHGKKTIMPEMRSFKRVPDTEPFLTFRITHQTVYWLILCALVLGLGIWVTYLNIQVQQIYDQIDRNGALQETSLHQPKKN